MNPPNYVYARVEIERKETDCKRGDIRVEKEKKETQREVDRKRN